MIGMVLIFIFGIYLFLFLLVGKKTSNWFARLLGWGVLLAPLLWLTWDIPVGHYKFKKLCEREGGIRIYVKNPKPATRIRLEGSRFGFSGAEDLLLRYPSLQQIEAEDKKYDYISDPNIAYALYERDENKNIVSKLMDEVDITGPNPRVTYSAPSKAEYYLSYEKKEYPFRIGLERYVLRSADNTVIGAATWTYFAWSEPDHTLFGRTYKLEECGCSPTDDDKLIDLLAQRVEIKREWR